MKAKYKTMVRDGRKVRFKYDWDGWFAASSFVLKKNRDFTCAITTMAQQVRNAAADRGLHVSLREEGSSLSVQVRGDK